MNCPVCTQPMVDITVPRLTSGFMWERWRCEPCKITARVEITYSSDESDGKGRTPTSSEGTK